MMSRLTVLGSIGILLAVSVAAAAQAPLPAAAVKFEAAEQWDEAVALYRVALRDDPSRADLWMRVADIEAKRRNFADAITALQRAAELRPFDALVFSKLSQAHAAADQPKQALAAIEVAVKQAPISEHLRARAILATWNADYGRARDSYRRLAKLEPHDVDVLPQYARVAAWDGATDEAAGLYRRYLRLRPEAADVWLELAKAEAWRGNYAGALDALNGYRDRFGESPDYSQQLAAVLAVAGRPRAASENVVPLLEQSPEDYQLNLTQAIAFAMQERPREAYRSLETVRRIRPEGRETQSAEQILRSLLSSAADPRYSVYSDSDHLQVQRLEPRASVSFRSGTRLSAGYELSRLDARMGSGLEQLNGSLSAEHRHAWAAASQKFGAVTFNGRAGYAMVGANDMTTYAAGLDVRPVDGFRFAAERSSGFLVISPRTAGMGISSESHRVQLDIMPALQYHLALDASYHQLSDGNRRWEIVISPRRSVARTSRINLDLGVSAYLLGTKYDLNHGYYDPRQYEHYALAAYPYFKVRENIGVALTAALGVQRDRIAPAFRFGGTLTGETTFGIYQPWMLKVSGSATLNRRLASGAYRGVGGSVSLVKRF